jgi:hypothetical protein
MVQTLADSVRCTRLREAFTRDTMAALSDMKTSGSGYELGQVLAYFSDLASHRKGLQAKPLINTSNSYNKSACSPYKNCVISYSIYSI